MTKAELIDAVKRWQVAEDLIWHDSLSSYPWIEEPSFLDTTNIFLALLEQLEPETDRMVVVDLGRLIPVDSNRGTFVSIREIELADPGVGFGG